MAAVKLVKGQNATLGQNRIGFRLLSTPADGLDMSALLLDSTGSIRTEPDFVFYNQPSHPSGAVRHLTGPPTGQRIEVDLSQLENDIDRVVIAASVDTGTLRRYRQADLLVSDRDSEQDIYRLDLAGEGSEAALLLAEIYRRNGNWKLRAISQGYATGLAGLATDHGISIAEPPEASQLSYQHPDRSSRPAASPAAHQPAVHAVATPPPRRAPTGLSEPPTIVAASQTWNEIKQRARTNVTLLSDAINAALRAFDAARPSISETMTELDTWYEALRLAWTNRFPRYGPPATPGKEPWSLTEGFLKPTEWARQAQALITELDSRTIKLTSEGRRIYRLGLSGQYSELIRKLPDTRTGVRQSAWDSMVGEGPDRGAIAAQEIARSWPEIQSPPPPIGPFSQAVGDGSLTRGVGVTQVLVGYARPEAITFSADRPATPGGHRQLRIEMPTTFRFPVVLDLDRVGGYVTGTPQVVEATVLSLLAGSPPGQVKLDIFDPDRLGESANFLYGLGDATEKVLGQKVRTTAKELAELLVEIEEHITFVTQKYLQGSFDSLTAYNQASGDVSEPYRVLVIYDYPSGFSRDHQYDQEQLDRLQKILAAGRRCGVFTLIVHSAAASERANQVSQELPWLSRAELKPEVVAASLGLDSAARELLRGSGHSRTPTVHWAFEAVPAVPAQIRDSMIAHIERGLRTAADVRVLPDRVCELAQLKMERDVARGTRQLEPVVAAYDPATWWHSSSIDEVTAIVGRLGASDTAQLRLDSQTASSILIGGRPGSGKSVLLHSLILSCCQRYSPDELALYLVDFKEGVEFKQYATYRLPQAKVIAIESEREFGVSVLESLANEIVRRGQLFRQAGSGEETNLGHYRRRTGRPLPRVMLIIDEFQVLFDRDDKIGSLAAELLERILRTGRAFGVHVVLASQTIAGMPALGRHLPNLIPTRVVLQSADADSRLLLSEDNADAKLLSRPGEAILNTKGGMRDANQRFQSTFWEPEERAWVLDQLHLRAAQSGLRELPVVFEGHRGATVDAVASETFSIPGGKTISLPLGMPMTLSGPVRAELRREPGANLLAVMEDPGMLVLSVAVLGRAGITTELLDFGGADEDGEARLHAAAASPSTTVARRREARARLIALAELIDERLQLNDYAGKPVVLVVHGLHRAREFDTATEFDDNSESGLLKKILRDGPEVGVHTLAWADKKASVDRRLSYEMLREFALRLCGPTSREDSLALIDSDEAATLHPGQAVFDDHDQSRCYRLRAFAGPPPEWSANLLGVAAR